MALPKAMKRAAASPARGNDKKKMRKRSSAVVKALKQSDMPADAKKMLLEAATVALAAYADERHPFQAKVVSMTEKAFNDIEAKLQAAIRVAQERVESLDEGKLQNAVMQQAQALAYLKSTVANKEADEMEAKMKLPKANERLKLVQREALAGDLEHAEALRAKEKLDSLLQAVEKMKAEPFVKRAATKVTADLTSFGVDASLLATLFGVITKPVEERGEFDALTLSNLDAELAEKGKAVNAKLSELEPARAQRDAVGEAAQQACDVVHEHVNITKAALADSKAAAADGEGLLRATEADLKGYAKNLQKAQVDLKAAEKKLADFQCGALQDFRNLQSICTPSVAQVTDPTQANTEA